MLIDQAPATLNPRTSLDAAGQRINALVYSALTRIDPALEPIPDLSEKWTNHGNDVVFTLKKGLHDHAGQPITSEDMRACLENYRITKPVSPYRAAFPQWTATEAQGQTVTLKLKEPNPYIARNVSLLRFFRVPGAATPCSEPEPGREVIGSGPYRFEKWEIQPDTSVTLLPVEHPERPKLEIAFIYDYTAGAMKLLRGEADAILTALSLTKTEWIKREHADQFRVLERNGIGVNYLNYNLKDPILSHAEVRRAIALAIDRPTIVRDKLLNYCDVADSLLSPGLPEASPQKFTYDPGEAARLLDQAGFPLRGSARFTIKLKTSATKEAVDMALILRDQLSRVGIDIALDVVEPAVFFASIRKRAYQLYVSRWLGVADGSILYRTLHTGQFDNRSEYSNPEVDALLDHAIAEPDLPRRKAILAKVQVIAAKDLPFFPLWYWNHDLIMRKELQGLEARELSISGALDPLAKLHW